MVKTSIRKQRKEAGQATILVSIWAFLFLLGARGFIIDGSHLYAQRLMAQAAADAAAQAGIMSIFDGTSGAWGTYTGATASGTGISSVTTGMSTSAACIYAQSKNGFNLAGDVVTVTPNPTVTVCPSNSCLSGDPINLLQVTVQRSVKTTLMGLLGSSASTIKAVGIAGIVTVTSPTPILITHPTLSGALSMNGTTGVTICGGPSQSIQINSSSSTAFSSGGSVNLSHAGPLDSGNCTTGTGANFGVFGGPATNPGNVTLGTLPGNYVSPSSPIQDPLAGVSPPSKPTTTPPQSGQSCSVLGHCSSCPGGAKTCTEFLPGLYTSAISTPGTAMFDPGIYYLEGGFSTKNSTVGMCGGCTADPTTVNGMLLYDTVATPKTGTITASNCDATGGFGISTNSTDTFLGAGISASSPTSAPAAPYYGILFFEDRNACAKTHTLGQGNGCFSLVGTIYITNTLAIMTASPALYQSVAYHGTPCSGTANFGEIIVSQLTIKGTSGINMGLFPNGFLKVRQVALVD